MADLIGAPCSGCGNVPIDCTCERVVFRCAEGHEQTVKVGAWQRDETPRPRPCEACFKAWQLATFPMKPVRKRGRRG